MNKVVIVSRGPRGQISTGSGAVAPTTVQVPPGKSVIWKNTADSSLRLYHNDGGTLRSVALV